MIEFIPIGRISFMLFSDDSINFSAFFPVLFCIFPSACEKSAAFFYPDHPFSEIFSLRRNNFSSLFPSGTEKFFCPFRYFLRFSWIFSKEKSLFSGMNFRSERTFFPFLGEYFQIFFVSSDKEFHPSRGIFRSIRQEFSPFRLFSTRSRRARTCTRVIIYWVPLPASFPSFRKTCRKTYLKHSYL